MHREESPPISKIKVIHVDDQRVIRVGVKLLLEGYPDIQLVGQAGTRSELFRALEVIQADILILDLNFHDRIPGREDGLTICHEVAQQFPKIKTIIFTASEKVSNVQKTFAAGARGFILKSTTFDQLVSAIGAVHRGENFICPRMQAKMNNQQ
jgi:DNA-binding NarL/FixJ family response regulator